MQKFRVVRKAHSRWEVHAQTPEGWAPWPRWFEYPGHAMDAVQEAHPEITTWIEYPDPTQYFFETRE